MTKKVIGVVEETKTGFSAYIDDDCAVCSVGDTFNEVMSELILAYRMYLNDIGEERTVFNIVFIFDVENDPSEDKELNALKFMYNRLVNYYNEHQSTNYIQVLRNSILEYKKLKHHYDTTQGLWCTDQPEAIPEDKKDLFFQIGGEND